MNLWKKVGIFTKNECKIKGNKMEENKIPVPCNCEYRDKIFKDLEKVMRKYELNNIEFCYSMIQLAVYYSKMLDFTDKEIMEFMKSGVDSLEIKD